MKRREFIKRTWKPTIFGILVPQYAIAQRSNRRLLMNVPPAAAGGGSPSFTIVQSKGAEEDASDTSTSVQLTSVAAGNMVVVGVSHEGAAATITVSDGEAYTGRTKLTSTAAGSDLHLQIFYLLSVTSTGTKTIVATFSAARTFKRVIAFEIDYVGTAAYDTEPSGGGTSGNSTAVNSGNMTTTGSVEIAFGFYAPYSAQTLSSPLINGAAMDSGRGDDDDTTSPFTAGRGVMWAKVVSGTFTGAASATLGGSDVWSVVAAAFKTT